MKGAEPSLDGAARNEAARLGGADRYARLRELADLFGYDLDKPDQRATAEARLFREVSSTLSAARSLDEALFVAADSPLRFSEDGSRLKTHAELVAEVVKQRPDLRGVVPGNRESDDERDNPEALRQLHADELKRAADKLRLNLHSDKDRATAMRVVSLEQPELLRRLYFSERAEREPTEAEERAATFTEQVTLELRRQGCAPSKENIKRASNYVRKTFPHLVNGCGGSGRK